MLFFHVGKIICIVSLLLGFKGRFSRLLGIDIYWRLMTGNLAQWHAIRKSHVGKNFIFLFEILVLCWHYLEKAYISFLHWYIYFYFLQCLEDIERNLGPRKLKKSLSVCHWDFNSLSAYNFSKLMQLKAYNSIYKHEPMLIMWLIWSDN